MSYFTYWGLSHAPFDNVPDPRMYWPQNPCLEDAISEILFAIEEGNECLAVIVGDIGTGKTLALRVLLHDLSPEKYKVAFLTNPTLTATQILREIVGQLENKKIDTRWKDHLQEEFNQIMYNTANEGKRIVIFIDEANVLSSSSLQGLRLLTNMQDDTQNLVTFVLAGQKELAKKLEKPSMENLYQRIGVYCKVKGLDSWQQVADYVSYRLKQAGSTRRVFTDSAIQAVWKHSHGVPRIVNKICKLCLKAGETNGLETIDETIVNGLAYMFKKGFFSDQEKRQAKETTGGSKTRKKAPSKAEEPAPIEEDALHSGIIPLGSATVTDTVGNHPPAPDRAEIETPGASGPTSEYPKEESQRDLSLGSPAATVRFDEASPRSDTDESPLHVGELLKNIPPEVLDRLCAMEERQLYRLAGQLAAKQLRENETLRNAGDPISHWERMRNDIVVTLQQFSRTHLGRKAEYN